MKVLSFSDKKMSRLGLILAVAIVVLVAIRLAIPPVAKWYINKTLASGVAGYYGQIEDFDLRLILGQYSIQGIVLRKAESLDSIRVDQPPYLVISDVTFSVFWGALFKGHLRGTVDIDKAVVNVIHDPKSGYTQTGAEGRGAGILPTADALFPMTIEDIRIHNSSVRFLNPAAQPPVDLAIQNIELAAENITNARNNGKALPSKLDLTAALPTGGGIKMFSEFNLMKKPLPFNLDLNVDMDNLTLLNPFFTYYMNFDISEGKLNISSEVAGNEKCMRGYVKPVFENLDFSDDKGEKYDGLSNFFIEQGLSLANFIIRFYPKDRTATKIEFETNYEDLSVDTWKSITNLFRNAFVKAYNPTLDHNIDASDSFIGCRKQKES